MSFQRRRIRSLTGLNEESHAAFTPCNKTSSSNLLKKYTPNVNDFQYPKTLSAATFIIGSRFSLLLMMYI